MQYRTSFASVAYKFVVYMEGEKKRRKFRLIHNGDFYEIFFIEIEWIDKRIVS